jgi:hypothetical protein
VSEPLPKHREMSGYLNNQLRWVYSAWDANRYDWRDLGTDHEQAQAAVAAWPDEEQQ